MKIALAHDYLNQYGGAERVLQVLCAMFPRAPIYTTIYDEAATGGVFKDRVIRTSFLQRLPGAIGHHHAFSPLMPLAVEQFDTSDYDVVLSVSASFIKGLITAPHTRHIDYCLTPPRFLWDDSHKFVDEFKYPWPLKKIAVPALSYLRIWDREASHRVDKFLAISGFVKDRINKYYGRESEIIYPPVAVEKFTVAEEPGEYFLMVGRLVAYKKFDLAVRVFNRLGWPLKIVGTGIEAGRLKKLAGPNIEFLGLVDDEKLAEIYRGAKALVFPQEEDFGIVPLESMASGRPVIAYGVGGVLETVQEGATGMFFNEQTEDALSDVLKSFDALSFDPNICRKRAEQFDVVEFRKNILAAVQPI